MLHDIVLFAPVLIKIKGIEADSQVEACEELMNRVYGDDSHGIRLTNLLNRNFAEGRCDGVVSVEAAENGEFGFLVDEVGDEDYDRSQCYCLDQDQDKVVQQSDGLLSLFSYTDVERERTKSADLLNRTILEAIDVIGHIGDGADGSYVSIQDLQDGLRKHFKIEEKEVSGE